MLTAEDLDQFALLGCQAPGCDHKDHVREVYLAARCCWGRKLDANPYFSPGYCAGLSSLA
jgi:hypothetical protein